MESNIPKTLSMLDQKCDNFVTQDDTSLTYTKVLAENVWPKKQNLIWEGL